MDRLRGLPLAAKVPLLVAALMTVLGAVASERVLTRLAAIQEEQLRDLAGLYFDGLAIAVLPAALRGDVWEAFDALDRATRQRRSISALATTLATADGRILASSDPLRFPSGDALPEAFSRSATPETLTLAASNPSVFVRAPLVYQAQEVGHLHAELDVSDLLADRRRAIVYLLAGNALATALLSLIGYVLVRRLLRPLSVLAEHMERDDGPALIEADNFPRGADAFGRLFQKYNALVRSERERLADARRLADQEKLVSLGRLASSVAHEVNNPLGGLLNAVDTLKRHGHRQDVSERSIALIERGLLGIRDVVRAMLETYRPRMPGHSLSATDFEDLRVLVGPEIRRLRQGLRWSVEEGALNGQEIDSGPIRQAVLNLLLNASAAAGSGGRVELTVKRTEDGLVISVANDGAELPPEVRERLEKGDVPAVGGGVGLRIVNEMSQFVGGRIRVKAVEGATRIDLVVPAASDEGRAA